MRRLFLLTAIACSACPDTPGARDSGVTRDAGYFDGTTELDLTLAPAGRVYVSLSSAEVVIPADGGASSDWDLAFEGEDVFTNSGASGPGQGGAFGPLGLETLLEASAPEVPFIFTDKPGGAFLDWYAYDGDTHVLYSRFHVYGVKSGGRLFKVQLLSYYGQQDNTAVGALYQVRFAEVTAGTGSTQTLQVDGTAGGLSAPPNAPSGCVTLATGVSSPLTLEQAQSSTAWDLCFRRDAVSVNGEAGGPGGASAVDLNSSDTPAETLSMLKDETAATQQAPFDAVSRTTLTNAAFRGDHIVSAFGAAWHNEAAWLVVSASGAHFLVGLDPHLDTTTQSSGTVVLHIKPVTTGNP